MTRGSYGILGRSSQTNNQPTADIFAPFVEKGRALSAHNALWGSARQGWEGEGSVGGEPGRKVEPVGWEAPLWGGEAPGLGDVTLGRAKPCNSNNKRQVGSDTLLSCSHWSAEGCTGPWGFCRTQDDAHTGTQYLWLEQSQLFWLKAVGCVVFATGLRHLQPPESFDRTGPTADDRLSGSCTFP